MKLTILTLALCALVGTALAVPPKSLNAKRRTSTIHKLAKAKIPTAPKNPGRIHRLDNEGYVPAVTPGGGGGGG